MTLFLILHMLLYNTSQTPTCPVKILGQTGSLIHLRRKDMANLYVLRTDNPDCRVLSYSIELHGGTLCFNEMVVRSDTIPAQRREMLQKPSITSLSIWNIRLSCPGCTAPEIFIYLHD